MKKLFPSLILSMLAAFVPVMGQCKVGVQAPPVGFWTWAPGSKIKVYVVSSDFRDTERKFLLAPLDHWNSVSEATGAKVEFQYKGTVAAPVYCENCLTILRGPVFDQARRHLTELRAYSAARNRILTWANIVIDPLLTRPRTLTNAVAHELGHSFGLLDCYSCRQNSSLMVQFKTVNVSNEMDGPSSCDLKQVKTVYQAMTTSLRRLGSAKPAIVDEGEEPEDDDTPVIVRKP